MTWFSHLLPLESLLLLWDRLLVGHPSLPIFFAVYLVIGQRGSLVGEGFESCFATLSQSLSNSVLSSRQSVEECIEAAQASLSTTPASILSGNTVGLHQRETTAAEVVGELSGGDYSNLLSKGMLNIIDTSSAEDFEEEHQDAEGVRFNVPDGQLEQATQLLSGLDALRGSIIAITGPQESVNRRFAEALLVEYQLPCLCLLPWKDHQRSKRSRGQELNPSAQQHTTSAPNFVKGDSPKKLFSVPSWDFSESGQSSDDLSVLGQRSQDGEGAAAQSNSITTLQSKWRYHPQSWSWGGGKSAWRRGSNPPAAQQGAAQPSETTPSSSKHGNASEAQILGASEPQPLSAQHASYVKMASDTDLETAHRKERIEATAESSGVRRDYFFEHTMPLSNVEEEDDTAPSPSLSSRSALSPSTHSSSAAQHRPLGSISQPPSKSLSCLSESADQPLSHLDALPAGAPEWASEGVQEEGTERLRGPEDEWLRGGEARDLAHSGAAEGTRGDELTAERLRGDALSAERSRAEELSAERLKADAVSGHGARSRGLRGEGLRAEVVRREGLSVEGRQAERLSGEGASSEEGPRAEGVGGWGLKVLSRGAELGKKLLDSLPTD